MWHSSKDTEKEEDSTVLCLLEPRTNLESKYTHFVNRLRENDNVAVVPIVPCQTILLYTVEVQRKYFRDSFEMFFFKFSKIKILGSSTNFYKKSFVFKIFTKTCMCPLLCLLLTCSVFNSNVEYNDSQQISFITMVKL